MQPRGCIALATRGLAPAALAASLSSDANRYRTPHSLRREQDELEAGGVVELARGDAAASRKRAVRVAACATLVP